MLFTETITLASAVKGIERIVNRHGADHIALRGDGATGCIYAEIRDSILVPICIVGQFFADRGVLRALMGDVPNVLGHVGEPTQEGACNMENAMWSNLVSCGIEVTDDAKTFLRWVQEEQDAGTPWGAAYDNGLRMVREMLTDRLHAEHREVFNAVSLASPVEPVEREEMLHTNPWGVAPL